MTDIALFWFRRDLRLEDNAGLYHALKAHCNVQPIFIFDTAILNKLEDRDDRRVNFIYEQLQQTEKQLQKAGSTLWIFHGEPMEVFKSLCENTP